jgi:hypothetical protein
LNHAEQIGDQIPAGRRIKHFLAAPLDSGNGLPRVGQQARGLRDGSYGSLDEEEFVKRSTKFGNRFSQ